jgi:hypothetical protein
MKFAVLVLLPVLIAVTLVYVPNFWVKFAILVDFYTPWVLFDSPIYEQYHQFLLGRLPERAEEPLIEIPHTEATFEVVQKLSQGFTWPVVIRGMLENSSALQLWNEEEFWRQYASEEVLCGTLFDLINDCTMGKFLDERANGKPFYISGASAIFENHPELHDMIDTPQIKAMEPGHRKSTQIFMGVPGMGSDIHCAVGINMYVNK